MMQAIILVPGVTFIGFAIWKFLSGEWVSAWRTRRTGPTNNWQNEGYMANQDGKSWSEIDGTIANTAPPQRGGGGTHA
jgi:hypothetical protein